MLCSPSLQTKYLLALKLPHIINLTEEVNPSRSCSLRNSFSLEYITHYCISCRNQMQTLSSAIEHISFVGKKCINHDIFSLPSRRLFHYGHCVVLFPCLKAAVPLASLPLGLSQSSGRDITLSLLFAHTSQGWYQGQSWIPLRSSLRDLKTLLFIQDTPGLSSSLTQVPDFIPLIRGIIPAMSLTLDPSFCSFRHLLLTTESPGPAQALAHREP